MKWTPSASSSTPGPSPTSMMARETPCPKTNLPSISKRRSPRLHRVQSDHSWASRGNDRRTSGLTLAELGEVIGGCHDEVGGRRPRRPHGIARIACEAAMRVLVAPIHLAEEAESRAVAKTGDVHGVRLEREP